MVMRLGDVVVGWASKFKIELVKIIVVERYNLVLRMIGWTELLSARTLEHKLRACLTCVL